MTIKKPNSHNIYCFSLKLSGYNIVILLCLGIKGNSIFLIGANIRPEKNPIKFQYT